MALTLAQKEERLKKVAKFLGKETMDLPDLGGGFEKPYNIFDQDEDTTKLDYNNLVGILDTADELGLDEGIQESLYGVGLSLDQKLDNYELGMPGLRSFNQEILDKVGGLGGWFVDIPNKIKRDLNAIGANYQDLPDRGEGINVRGGLKDLASKVGIGYGDVDDKTLPSGFRADVGKYSADVVPYAFGFNRFIMNPANPFGKPLSTTVPLTTPKFGPKVPGSGPVSGMQTYKSTPNNFESILANMRRFPAESPISAGVAEVGSTLGYGAGMSWRDDSKSDPEAGYVKQIFFETLPLITTVFGGVGPELVKAGTGAIGRGLQRSLGTGDAGLVGRTVRGLINTIKSDEPGLWKGFKSGFKGTSEEAKAASSETIVGKKQKWVGSLMGYLKNTKQNIKLHLQSNSKLKNISDKTDEEIELLAEKYAAIQLDRAFSIAKENPAVVLKNIKASNERLASLSSKELDDEIGQLAAIASQRGDDPESQSPLLMALTNYEAKNNEAFLKRFAHDQNQREMNLNDRINNIIAGSESELSGMTYAEAVKKAIADESQAIEKTIDDFVSASYNTLKTKFERTDDEAASRTTQMIREIYKDVKNNEKSLWDKTKEKFDVRTSKKFTALEKAQLESISSNPADQLYNNSLKKPINIVINKLKKGESISYKEAYNLKQNIDLVLSKEIDVDPQFKNQPKIEELFNLRKAINQDIGEGFAFAKEASAVTKGKHETFTRNNTVHAIVNRTSRNTFAQEESQLAEILLEKGVAKYEKTPFALNELQDAIKGSVKLTGKEIAEQTKLIKDSEVHIQNMLALMVDDVFDPGTGTFNPTKITQWISENNKIINKYPKFQELLEGYKNNIGKLVADLESNAFELNTVSRDPFTNEIKLVRKPKTNEVNYFAEIINSDNPSVVLERVLLDQEVGSSQLMNIIANTKNFPNSKEALTGLKSSIVEAISRIGFRTSKDIKTKGQLVASDFSTLLASPHGANKTLRETLQKTGLFTDQELKNLDTALRVYDQDLGALNNPNLFRSLKELDPTNGMIDTFVRIAAANFSTNFSTGAGAGLVIAGRFTKLGTAMLESLKNQQIKKVIEDALLDSKKMEKLLTVGENLKGNTGDINSKNKGEAYVKFKTFLLAYGVELTYPKFEKAWEDMIFEERVAQGQLDALKYGVQ